MRILPQLSWLIASLLVLQACSSKKEYLEVPPLSDYFPMAVGKQLTYRLDSTVLTQFGADTTVRRYRVRYTTDAEITDALGRKGYRVFLSISDSGGTTAYRPINTFLQVPQADDWIESVENNLRFMKIRNPIIENFEWPGNSYIDASSQGSSYTWLNDWRYTYINVGQPFTVREHTFENTITVLQRDEESPAGGFSKDMSIKQWDYSIEVYAKGVGLIYKNWDHKVWDGPPAYSPGRWRDGSFRVVMQLVDWK